MRKNISLNMLLSLVVIVLALGLIWIKQQPDNESRLPLNVSELTRIEIVHSRKIVLTKNNNQWHMTQPEVAALKPEKIRKIFTHLQLPLKAGFSAQEADLSLYGLDSPRMRVLLNHSELAFGALNTMEQMHYIMFADKIYLAPPFLHVGFDQSVNDLILKQEL